MFERRRKRNRKQERMGIRPSFWKREKWFGGDWRERSKVYRSERRKRINVRRRKRVKKRGKKRRSMWATAHERRVAVKRLEKAVDNVLNLKMKKKKKSKTEKEDPKRSRVDESGKGVELMSRNTHFLRWHHRVRYRVTVING
jgi:hypothetical protein